MALGAATTHTMNLSREELDISNKDTGEYGDTELGQISWDIQADSMMIEADYDSLVDAFYREKYFMWHSLSRPRQDLRRANLPQDGLLGLEDMRETYVSPLSRPMPPITTRPLIPLHLRAKARCSRDLDHDGR